MLSDAAATTRNEMRPIVNQTRADLAPLVTECDMHLD